MAAGHSIVGSYRRVADALSWRTGGDTLWSRSILATGPTSPALPDQIDAIIHVAGISDSPGITREAMLRCNVTGAANLHRYALAAGARKLVYMSSLMVHGKVVEPVLDHDTPIRDPGLYGASKFCAERLFAADQARLPTLALRLPGVLGRRAHRAWVPTVLHKIRHGQEVLVYNPDHLFNNAAHVDDIGRFVTTLLDRNWDGFAAMPLAAAGAITVRQAIECLGAASGCVPRLRVVAPPQPGFTISSELACRAFGYQPMGIGDMLRRYAGEESQAPVPLAATS